MTQTEGKKRLLDTRMVPAPSQGIIPERDLLSTPVLEARHLGIEHGQVDRLGLHDAQRLAARAGGDGRHPLRFEQVADRLMPAFLFVGQQHGQTIERGRSHHEHAGE